MVQNPVNTANGALVGSSAKQIQILYVLVIFYFIYWIYCCSLFSVLTRSPFIVIMLNSQLRDEYLRWKHLQLYEINPVAVDRWDRCPHWDAIFPLEQANSSYIPYHGLMIKLGPHADFISSEEVELASPTVQSPGPSSWVAFAVLQLMRKSSKLLQSFKFPWRFNILRLMSENLAQTE